MARSLIDSIYDTYLRKSGKGLEYDVPICIGENGSVHTISVRVWAQNETEAEERAVAAAHTATNNVSQNIRQKSMGLVLPAEHYKPKGFARTVTSPFAMWRDPVYKKATSNILGSAGYRAGTMTKLSIKEFRKPAAQDGEDVEIDRSYLLNALRTNVISLFIWIGLCLLGGVFMLLGIHPGNVGRSVITWINPYIVASIVCLVVGVLAVFKTVKDYQWIVNKLDEIEKNPAKKEASSDG